MNTSKGGEYINEEGAVERKVESTKYETPAGKQQPGREEVEVIHIHNSGENPGVGGAVTDAATKVAEKIESAKKTVCGSGTGDEDTKRESK